MSALALHTLYYKRDYDTLEEKGGDNDIHQRSHMHLLQCWNRLPAVSVRPCPSAPKKEKKMNIEHRTKNDWLFLTKICLFSVSLLEKMFIRESALESVIELSKALSRMNKLVFHKYFTGHNVHHPKVLSLVLFSSRHSPPNRRWCLRSGFSTHIRRCNIRLCLTCRFFYE